MIDRPLGKEKWDTYFYLAGIFKAISIQFSSSPEAQTINKPPPPLKLGDRSILVKLI